MIGSTLWEVHLYAPAEGRPASNDKFTRFESAFRHAMTLMHDHPKGWRIQVVPPVHATPGELAQLRENALHVAT
jgi:hypothetical protein